MCELLEACLSEDLWTSHYRADTGASIGFHGRNQTLPATMCV